MVYDHRAGGYNHTWLEPVKFDLSGPPGFRLVICCAGKGMAADRS